MGRLGQITGQSRLMDNDWKTVNEGDITEIGLADDALFMIDEKRGEIPELYRNPHRHRFYEMIWIRGGNGAHVIDFIDYVFETDRLYLITPGQVHQWRTCDIQATVIVFSEALLDRAYREMLLQGARLFRMTDSPPFLDLDTAVSKRLSQLSGLMFSEYARKPVDTTMVRPLLSAFLYELARLERHGEQVLGNPHYKRLSRMTELIDAHYHEHRSVEFYAQQLHITSKRLNEVTREIIGKSVSQMVHDRVILEAKRDLSLSQDSVKTISYRLGFQDPSYFGRFFRRQVGQSPNAFRDGFQRLPH
ncbi:AraC family transcriptional regulator [Motiliproteus sp. MSK22-1]|uniref:helix-turn-helix domain-containing protein n=1 Tax=Motiliproteus sp. MSK22-1 TaxID=1897630 RepID=UPI000977EB19|nr:AraC family transcriptional regulator [Motiliproteus sp. MSK22-1]OMH26620.1 hypothetical protein BGP75_23270 [Motiliproteus sp. MSK22-1]